MPAELVPIVADAAQPVTKAVSGTLSEVWQGIIGDRVTGWRIANAVKLDAKLKEKLDDAGVVLRQDSLPEGVAYKWFEQATQADEPEIQELFAQLLANAATGNADALRKRNIELVSSLSPEDAKLLAFLSDRYAEHKTSGRASFSDLELEIGHFFYLDYKKAGFESDLPIDSLISLGILRYGRDFAVDEDTFSQFVAAATSPSFGGIRMSVPDMMRVKETLSLTEVGKSLIEALFPSNGTTAK